MALKQFHDQTQLNPAQLKLLTGQINSVVNLAVQRKVGRAKFLKTTLPVYLKNVRTAGIPYPDIENTFSSTYLALLDRSAEETTNLSDIFSREIEVKTTGLPAIPYQTERAKLIEKLMQQGVDLAEVEWSQVERSVYETIRWFTKDKIPFQVKFTPAMELPETFPIHTFGDGVAIPVDWDPKPINYVEPQRVEIIAIGSTDRSEVRAEKFGDRVNIYPDRRSMGEAAARLGIEKIEELLKSQETARIVFAAAPSQVETIEALVRLSKGRIDWSRIEIFHMDEFAGFPEGHPVSFRTWLDDNLINPLIREHGVPREALKINLIQADSRERTELEREAERYGRLLSEKPIDIVFGGYGYNGHVAFNDPPADFETSQNVIVVNPAEDPVNAQQQIEAYPDYFKSAADIPLAVTISLPPMKRAKLLILSVPGKVKAEAIRDIHSVEGKAENALADPKVPGTFFNSLPPERIQIFTDPAGATLLPGRSEVRKRNEGIKTLLVVEDSDSDFAALKEKLAGEEAFRGIRVLRARSARGAKRILRRRGKEIDAGVFDFHLMSIAKYATLSEEEWWPHSPLAIFNEMRRLRLNFSVVIMVGSNLWPRDSLKGIPAPIWDFAWKNEDYGQVIASLKNLDRELRPPDPASAKLLKLLRVAGMGPPFAGRSEARERRFVDVDQKGRFKPDGRPIVIFIEDDRRQMDFYKDSLFDALVEADHNQLLLVETLADEQVALEIATTAAVPKIIIADDQFPRTEGAQAQSLAEEVVTSAKKLGIPIVILSLRPKEEVIKTPTVEPDVFISKRDEMLFFKILAATHKFLSSRSEARSVIEKNLRLSELLQPSRLDSRFEEWKRNRPAGNAPPVRIVHLFPRSLQRYAFNLDNGLRGSGLPVEIAELSDDRTDIALVQLHGAESESPVAGYSGRKIVLVHRPEETLKRFNEAQISDFLGNAEAIVLLGESWVNEYRKRFPEKVVVAIPHGFFEAGQIEPHRLEPHTIQVVGSVTTWGEMRRLDDAIKLIRALKEQGSHSPILGYLGGTIDPKREDINRFKNDHDVWLLSNSEIQSAGDLGKYRDFFSFRKWLYDEARDRIIIRTDTAPESYAPIPKWEKQLVDFNVQFYREILKDDEPKVEYSGTLHLQAAPAIYVVLDSPSMHDVLKNEGFQMILVPARGKEIDYSEGAKRIRELISKPRERQRILENNLQAARRLGMEQIAFAYYTLITNLGIPRRSEARAVPKLGPTRPDLEAKYKKQVEASTPDYVKRNKLFDIHQKGAITVTLKREHLQPYDEKRNPEGLGLWAWLKDYEKEAKVATAGIRFAQNILYPWDTRFRINLVGVALATLGKALVAKERFSGAKLQKLAGGEVRYNTQEYIDLIARIQATQGIKTYLPSGRQTLPVWMASFLTFMYDLAGAEYVTSSHANSSFIATKDIDEEGSQYLPEESLRFVEKIREIFEKAETDGEYRFEIAPSDDPLINENFMTLIEDGTNLYAEYLRKGVATDVNLKRIKDIKRRVIVENVGGSLHRTVSPIFEKLGISNSFEWFRTQQDPFFHGIGKDIKDGRFIDYTQDVTIVKRDPKTGEVVSIPVAERMGYDTLLKDKEIGTVLLMADPDGDRMVTAQIESADRAGFLKGVGVDYLQLDDQRIVALYSPNQSFLLSMVYQAQSLKDAGLWDKHPRFIIMTTASSSAWREWAEKNGVNVLNVPVGFKEIAAMQRKIEHQIKSNPDQPAIVRDIFGKEVNLGVQPRMLFAGEESGGAIFGPEELILSLGGRMAIGMREKSDGEMLVIQSAMAAYLEELSQTLGLKQGLFLSDYFHLIVSPSKFDRTLFKTRDIRGQYPVESDINGKFDVREDVVYYNQSEPNPDILKKDKEVGEARRTKNYVFYLSLALAYRDGKVTKEQIISILNDLFGKDGFNFGDLSEIYFVGDGVFFQFPTKVLEIRPSGTDAKSKSYAMGENKGELARYAAVLGNYSGDITSLHAQYVPPEYSDPTKGMDLAWKRYQEYYRDGLPPKSYLPPSDYVDARSEVRGDLTRKALTDLLHSPLTVKLKTLPEGLKGYHVDITDLGNGTVNPRAFTLRIQLREGERAPKAIEALRAAAAAFQERLIQTFPRYRVSLRHEGRNGVQVSFSQIGFSSSAAERSEVRNVLEAAAREILANRGLATVAAEQRSRLLPERIREEKGEALFAEAVHLFLGEAAFAQEAGTSQKYAAARSILGVSSKSAYAYILAPEFAFNQGGLAFVGTVFGNNPVAVIVRTQNDFDFVEAFNREHGTDILAAGSVKEAQQKLRKGLADRGGTRLGGFVFHGIAAPGEVNADALRNAFPNQVTLMTPGLFERFAEAAGVETLVAELKARFYLARSA
jgi:6-phosphogluconolactonase/glucosamine-6-phosphate isomerase/deaminase/phosphomannomutase